VAAFYEGGIPYSELVKIPIDEFLEIIECANSISKARQRALSGQ
jgi:hypothetical protein